MSCPRPPTSPRMWFLSGVTLLSLGLATVGAVAFGIPFPLGLVGVLLSFALAAVSCRATGETDMTPSGTLGHVAQLAFGVLMPGNTLTNTMAASLSGNIAASSADLLTDVKAGTLLGAAPRHTFLAQLWGCVVGSALIVPVLLPAGAGRLGHLRGALPRAPRLHRGRRGPRALLGPGRPAGRVALGGPRGRTRRRGARPPGALRPRARPALRPLPIGLGIAFVLPASTCLSVFLGAVAAALLARARPALADAATVPLASGLIAGESLVGMAILLALSASS